MTQTTAIDTPRALALGLIFAAALATLGACGRGGPLDQPAPLYGAKAKADYQARKAAAAAAKADKDDGEPEPLAPDTPGPNVPSSSIPTLRADPTPGMPALPNASGPGGVLPDPLTHPQ